MAYRGRANVMTMGFHMMVRHPSLIAAVIGPWDHSDKALRKTGECVIAISYGGPGREGGGYRQLLGRRGRQVRAFRIDLDAGRKERRTLHHRGDGTFAVDGRILDLRERMVLWKQFQD